MHAACRLSHTSFTTGTPLCMVFPHMLHGNSDSPCVQIVPYHALKDSTGLTDERQLEDFIITSCFYGGLVSGKLDPQRQCLRTHSAVARDIRREDLGPVLAGFQGW